MAETNTPLHDLLPAQVYRELKHKLRRNLPEPPSGDPAEFEQRLHSAIAEIAAYAPAGAAELNLARRYVEAAEAADECLRLAYEAAREKSPHTMRLHAQSASFMRQAQGYHTRLLRMQNLRRKLAQDPNEAGRAIWTEHCTIRLLADDEPPETPSPQSEQQPTAAPLPRPLSRPQRHHRPKSPPPSPRPNTTPPSTPKGPRASATRAASSPTSTSSRPTPTWPTH